MKILEDLLNKIKDLTTFFNYYANYRKLFFYDQQKISAIQDRYIYFSILIININFAAGIYTQVRPKVFNRYGRLGLFVGAVWYNYFIYLFSVHRHGKFEMIKYFNTGEMTDFKKFQLNELDQNVKNDLIRYLDQI